MEISESLKAKLAYKIGRNEPCLCGSGKKFKKCCDGQKRQVRLERLLCSCTEDRDKYWIQHKIAELDAQERRANTPLTPEQNAEVSAVLTTSLVMALRGVMR